MDIFKALLLTFAAAPGLWGYQLRPRDAVSSDPYPFCNPAENKNCICGGKYLVPTLEFSLEDSDGDRAFNEYLLPHSFTISKWNNGKMPERCYYWGVTADHWNPTEFIIYNVTFDDCTFSPSVVCWHPTAPKNVTQIATEISRIPAKLRQSISMYLVYGDLDSDNTLYNGYMATFAADGIIIGRSGAYFATSLVHEMGHGADSNLVSPDAPHPGSGSAFSSTSAWQTAANADDFAVSAYGAGSYTEDFAEAGRAVLLDIIYPGGLETFTNNNPNLTQITRQLGTFKSVAGDFYTPGGTCDPAYKFPFPAVLVDVAPATTSSADQATATLNRQNGGSTYTGPTACGPGYTCSNVK
ncbi:hypothetical protein VTI74DRAFT_7615 [Chaetomium olivicolor]